MNKYLNESGALQLLSKIKSALARKIDRVNVRKRTPHETLVQVPAYEFDVVINDLGNGGTFEDFMLQLNMYIQVEAPIDRSFLNDLDQAFTLADAGGENSLQLQGCVATEELYQAMCSAFVDCDSNGLFSAECTIVSQTTTEITSYTNIDTLVVAPKNELLGSTRIREISKQDYDNLQSVNLLETDRLYIVNDYPNAMKITESVNAKSLTITNFSAWSGNFIVPYTNEAEKEIVEQANSSLVAQEVNGTSMSNMSLSLTMPAAMYNRMVELMTDRAEVQGLGNPTLSNVEDTTMVVTYRVPAAVIQRYEPLVVNLTELSQSGGSVTFSTDVSFKDALKQRKLNRRVTAVFASYYGENIVDLNIVEGALTAYCISVNNVLELIWNDNQCVLNIDAR